MFVFYHVWMLKRLSWLHIMKSEDQHILRIHIRIHIQIVCIDFSRWISLVQSGFQETHKGGFIYCFVHSFIQKWHIEKHRIHFSSKNEQLKCVSKHPTSVKAVVTNTKTLTTSKVKEWNVNAAINSTLPDKRYLCLTWKNRFKSKLISVNYFV